MRLFKNRTYLWKWEDSEGEHEAIGTLVVSTPESYVVNFVDFVLGIKRKQVISAEPY